jgi:gluconate 2-dehydrogenase gamma chain
MDRREHLKLLLAGGVGAGLFLATGCSEEDRRQSEEILRDADFGYGRADYEAEHDKTLFAETFFTESEFDMINVLSDIIIPADEESGSATDAGVPDFIEFMMKDFPPFQLVTRGGLMWLNNQCNTRFGKPFLDCSESERLEMIDLIAYPELAPSDMQYGVRFFNRMRDLVATGFFTSRMGVDYLGYQGNRPGFWNGVPEEVLAKHGFEYDQKTTDESIKESDRYRIVEWDDDMNPI